MTDRNGSPAPRQVGEAWGTGLALGTGVGVALGVALDDVGLGIGIGVAIGLAFAVAFGHGLRRRRGDEPTDAARDVDPEPPAADPR